MPCWNFGLHLEKVRTLLSWILILGHFRQEVFTKIVFGLYIGFGLCIRVLVGLLALSPSSWAWEDNSQLLGPIHFVLSLLEVKAFHSIGLSLSMVGFQELSSRLLKFLFLGSGLGPYFTILALFLGFST